MPIECDINDVLDWLIENGLTKTPVIIAHRRTKQLSVREVPNDNEPDYLDIRETQPELTPDSLSDALNLFLSLIHI